MSSRSSSSLKGLRLFCEGAASTGRLLLAPFGWRAARYHRRLDSEERLSKGLILILPGIDGCTTVSDNIARGVDRAGIRMAVQIQDWRCFPGWNPLHLTTHRRNQKAAEEIASTIAHYQSRYPDRPVHLVGHSAGAGMALFILRHLAGTVPIESTILLAPAVSRGFDAQSLAESSGSNIFSFWSRGDLPTVGLGTMVFGTMDRRHRVSAGALGFLENKQSESSRGEVSEAATPDSEDSGLHQLGYQYRMARYWNFGGHFGCTNSAFVAEYVAPLLKGVIA